MHVVLVDNLLMPEGADLQGLDRNPHLGLLALAAVLEGAGHRVTVYNPRLALLSGQLSFDATLYTAAAEALLELQPDVLGFTTMGCSFMFALRVAEAIHARRGELPIIMGGPHATILHRELLEMAPCVVAVARHEADETIVPLVERLASGDLHDLPGVTWRRGAAIVENPGKPTVTDLDALPIPAYHHHPIASNGNVSAAVDAGRGCPFKCTFCSTASFFGRQYRLKSPDRIVEEMDHLHARYGIRHFTVNHDLFTVNRKKVLAFCEVVKRRDYSWNCSARFDCVDPELLTAMADAGCDGIYFGVETGSPRMQRRIQKRLDLKGLAPALRATAKVGMLAWTSFIVGYPEETRGDFEDTLDVLGLCLVQDDKLVRSQLHLLTPEPGTGLYAAHRDALRFDGRFSDFHPTLLGDADRELVRDSPQMFGTYYYFPSLVERPQLLFAVELHLLLCTVFGGDISNYLLRHFDGRLSVMHQRLWDFQRARGGDGRATARLLERYFADVLGAEHHVLSLLRYAVDTVELRAAGGREPVTASRFDPATPYQLSPNAILFDSLHDCPSILQHVRAHRDVSATLPDEALGPRLPWAVLARDKGRSLDSFALSPMSLALLKRFRQPLSFTALSADPGELSPLPPDSVVSQMLRLGMLVPSSGAAPAPAPA